MGNDRESRRQFLKRTALIPPAVALSMSLPDSTGCKSPHAGSKEKGILKGSVYVGKRSAQKRGSNFSTKEAKELLEDGLRRISGGESRSILRSLFNPNNIIGIKVNCLAQPPLTPSIEILYALIELLKSNMIPEENIIVWERSSMELKRAGFPIRTGTKGFKCFGLDMLSAPYDSKPTIVGSIGSCFAKVVSRICDIHINLCVMKDHDLAGVSGAMKNYFGAIHNPNKYHENSCSPYIADLFSFKGLKDRVVLNISSALTAQFEGGPSYQPSYAWKFNGILLSMDMVAMDTVIESFIEEKRKEKGLPSLKEDGRPPLYLEVAEKKGIGIHSIEKIKFL